jgi:hypothetical protein
VEGCTGHGLRCKAAAGDSLPQNAASHLQASEIGFVSLSVSRNARERRFLPKKGCVLQQSKEKLVEISDCTSNPRLIAWN